MTYAPHNILGGYQKPIVAEQCTVAAGQDLNKGAALGKIQKAAGDALADGANTGDAAIVADSFALGTTAAKVGVYTAEAVETADTPTAVATTTGAGTQACSATAGDAYKVGDYILLCINAGTNDYELFSVIDPDGIVLGQIQAGPDGAPGTFTHEQISIELTGGGAGQYYVVDDFWTITVAESLQSPPHFLVTDPDGVPVGYAIQDTAFTDEIDFEIVDDGGDADLGDTFTFEVEARDLVALADKSEVDGRADFCGVLFQDVDATLADTVSVMAVEGEFDGDELDFSAAEDADTYRAEARALGVYFRTTY